MLEPEQGEVKDNGLFKVTAITVPTKRLDHVQKGQKNRPRGHPAATDPLMQAGDRTSIALIPGPLQSGVQAPAVIPKQESSRGEAGRGEGRALTFQLHF